MSVYDNVRHRLGVLSTELEGAQKSTAQAVMHYLDDLEDQVRRLIEFSAYAGLSWQQDDVEPITEAFRVLPDHLQVRINELEEKLTAEYIDDLKEREGS